MIKGIWDKKVVEVIVEKNDMLKFSISNILIDLFVRLVKEKEDVII